MENRITISEKNGAPKPLQTTGEHFIDYYLVSSGLLHSGGNILLLDFLFSYSKFSDGNIAIIANFGHFVKKLD